MKEEKKKKIDLIQTKVLREMYFKLDCLEDQLKREGRNVENQNIKRSERQKYFQDDQNVERSERQKSERQKEC